MLAGKFVDPSTHYEILAKAWAYHLNTPFPIDSHQVNLAVDLINAIFFNVHGETIDDILIDPVSFSIRVQEYRREKSENNSVSNNVS